MAPPLKGLRVVDLIRERAHRLEELERREKLLIAEIEAERVTIMKELRKLQADTRSIHRAIGVRMNLKHMQHHREDPRVALYLQLLEEGTK